MTVNEVKQTLGSFEIVLYPTTPLEILNQLDYLGHIAIVEGRIDPLQYGDEILDAAKYVGVHRNRVNDVDNRTYNVEGSYLLRGVGLSYWLGDEDGKGDVYETPVTITGQSLANSVRALLPDSIEEGTFFSVPGTYTGVHQYQSPRKAITYVTDIFDAEWRVNPNGTLDVGTIAQLYPTEPTSLLVKNDFGRDLLLAAYEGKIDSAEDIEDFSTRVVLLAEGEGSSIATGSADINPTLNPYRDLFGNVVVLTRLISESGTTSGNANTRASIALSEFDSTRRSIRLATREFTVSGTLNLGEFIYVHDPDTGLVDPTNEVYFRGRRINPIKFRVVEIEWPVTEGMTVAYRGWDGTWVDLTDWVNFEAGDVHLTIGELPRSLTSGFGEPIGSRDLVDDLSVPAAPTWDTPFFTSSYLDGMGNTRAQVLLTWNTPLNVDGSTIVDGDFYEIQYGFNPATEWQSVFAAWGSNEFLITDLAPGTDYDIKIRAIDRFGHQGAFSSTETITVSPDTIAPSTPAAPTVASSLIAIQVSHQLGLNSCGTCNLEVDLDHLEVHTGTVNTFTPDSNSLVGKMPANYGMMQAGIKAIGTFDVSSTSPVWVKVRAVDQAGNISNASPAASATATLIDNVHISDLSVTKVSAGTVSANWIIGASIYTAASGQRIELNSTGLHGFNSGGVETISLLNTGSFTLRTSSTGARVVIDATGIETFNSAGDKTIDIQASDGTVLVVGQITSSATSSKRLVVNPGPTAGSYEPEIRMYEEFALNEYHYWNNPDSPAHSTELGSAILSNRKSIVRLAPSQWRVSMTDSSGTDAGPYLTASSTNLDIISTTSLTMSTSPSTTRGMVILGSSTSELRHADAGGGRLGGYCFVSGSIGEVGKHNEAAFTAGQDATINADDDIFLNATSEIFFRGMFGESGTNSALCSTTVEVSGATAWSIGWGISLDTLPGVLFTADCGSDINGTFVRNRTNSNVQVRVDSDVGNVGIFASLWIFRGI